MSPGKKVDLFPKTNSPRMGPGEIRPKGSEEQHHDNEKRKMTTKGKRHDPGAITAWPRVGQRNTRSSFDASRPLVKARNTHTLKSVLFRRPSAFRYKKKLGIADKTSIKPARFRDRRHLASANEANICRYLHEHSDQRLHPGQPLSEAVIPKVRRPESQVRLSARKPHRRSGGTS